MKFLVILLVVFGLSAQAQQSWRDAGDYRTPRANTMKRVGLMADMNMVWVMRPDLPTITATRVEAGVMFGGGSISFLMLAGMGSHSQMIQVPVGVWDPVCGCTTAAITDFEDYLKIGYGQIGLALQGRGYSLNVSGGIASLARNQWVEQSDEGGQLVALPRTLSLIGQLSGQVKIGQDLFLINGQLADQYAHGTASYLLGMDSRRQQFFVGVHTGYIQHAVSGQEFLLGSQMVFNGGPNFRMFNFELAGGVAYNPNPTEGLGFFVNLRMTLNRQNKLVY